MPQHSQRALTATELLILLAMVGILGSVFVVPFYSCPAKWERAGLKAEFHFFTGCLVQRKDGTWIPEKALRDVNL